MGASSNSNAARLAALQDRKQSIEENLAKRNLELRQLCIQEAELTGIMPKEIPLESGESPPVFRRRIETSFQLPQNLINNLNNEEESITSLELNMQVQANMAEAALSLANESNISKTVRRQHMAQYQYHKRQYNALEDKLTFLKARSPMAQQSNLPHHKQKKKPRPVEQDDTVSMNVPMQHSEPFGNSVFRHSMRSLQHPLISDNNVDYRHSSGHQKLAYRNSDGSPNTDSSISIIRPEDAMVSGIYRLSLNGYKAYMDRKEDGHIIVNSHITPHFISSQSNINLYQNQPTQQLQYSHTSHSLPHSSQRTQQSIHGYVMYPQYNTNVQSDLSKYIISNAHNNGLRTSSSPNHTSSSKTSHYSPSYYPNCRQYSGLDQQFRTLNPHQLQPHQQYEHDVMTTGLGGYWKRNESGEIIWCNSFPNNTWQRDKRFGSLDRRRNKRIHKRTSPLVDPKSATISVVMKYPDSVQAVPANTPQLVSRSRVDNRQLVRTQSLGSVGAQTVDSVWPSDDNSSCGSDAHSMNEINLAARKQKQKEWFETSLDGPAPSTPIRSHSTVSSTIVSTTPSISPEEKYLEIPPKSLQSPQIHKPPLEIPAESHPHSSPTVHEPNMELFNNNIPKHGTLIQAGHCKPYHEETKPFEMSDFYKYSTKFKKSPVKQNESFKNFTEKLTPSQLSPTCQIQNNANESFDDDQNSVIQKGIYQPLQPMRCQPYSCNNNFDRNIENISSSGSINTNIEISKPPSNVENFSAEVNTWYQNHEQQMDNNNSGRPTSNNRSTATLV